MPTRCRSLLPWLLVPASLSAQPALLTTEQWLADVDQVYQGIVDHHPMPASRLEATDLRGEVATLKSQIPSLKDRQIVLRLARAVALLGDGHSRLEIPRMHGDVGINDAHGSTPEVKVQGLAFDRLPIEVRSFADGAFVTRATTRNRDLLGHRLVAINEVPVEAIIERLLPLAHGENDGWKRRIAVDRLSLIDALEFAEIPVSEGIDVVVSGEGGERAVSLSPLGSTADSWHVIKRPHTLLRNRNPERYYWFEALSDHNAVYLRYRRSGFDRDRPPVPFVESLLAAAATANWDRLIVDLRDNGGGNAMWNQPLLEALIGHPTFDQPGGLYVLIGPNTFSAAALFANELEQHTHALFVGTPSGNAPDHYSDPRRIQLDHSGLTMRVSTIHWKNWLAGEFRDALIPQIPAEERFGDVASGHDAALTAALTHQEGSNPISQFAHLLANVDVNAAAIYLTRIAMDPRLNTDLKEELLKLGLDYRKSNELTLSRYTLLLAETYYSDAAEVLYEYGRTLELLDRRDEALQQYQRAAERAPNDKTIRQALIRLQEAASTGP